MADTTTLKDAVEQRGPYAVWDLMNEDEQEAAAAALWTGADRAARGAIELALAQEMKFRPQSVRKLPPDRIVPRLVRKAPDLPDTVLFQFLFHLHMEERRPLLVEFLDAAGLPHEEGVLELPEEYEGPDGEAVAKAAADMVAAHGHEALVYLATLKVADEEFWSGLDATLDGFDAAGEAIAPAKPKPKKAKKAAKAKAKAEPKAEADAEAEADE